MFLFERFTRCAGRTRRRAEHHHWIHQRGQAGWLLVTVIILLSVVFVALAGLTFLLTEHMRVTSLRLNQTRAVALAQAGVMQAIYDFRRTNGVVLGTQTIDAGPPADVAILAGQQADWLLVNFKGTIAFDTAALPVCGATKRDRMNGWTVTNVLATGGSSLTFNRITVDWASPGTERVIGITLNGSLVLVNCAGVPSGFPITIPTQTVAPKALWSLNRIWWSSTGVMGNKAWVKVTFTLTDGSVRVSFYDRANAANRSADLTIRSRGEVHQGAFPFGAPTFIWRRIQAEYRHPVPTSWTTPTTVGGTVLSYRELDASSP